MSTVMLPDTPKTEEKNVKEGLQKALDLLREEGWVQGVPSRPNIGGGRSHCALGAIWEVMDDDPVYYCRMALQLLTVMGMKPGKDFVWTYRSNNGVKQSYLMPDVSQVASWNDASERTFEQVETVFEYAVSKAEREC